MRTEIITDGQALERLTDAWRDLHQRAGGTIFQSVEWLTSWWKVYGSHFALRVLALWQDGQLAGLVPCYVGRNALGAYARSMGEFAVFGAYAPLILPEALSTTMDPTADFFGHLLRVDRCGFIDYHHVPSPSPFFESLTPSLGNRNCLNVSVEKSLPRLLVQLPKTWDEYVRSLTSHERHFARLIARVEKQENPPFVIRVRHDMSGLDELVKLHSMVWAGRGQTGYFKGREGFESFFRTLLPSLLAEKKAAFYTVETGGEVVAVTVTFISNNQSCAYLSGRLTEHPLKKYSPGKALLTAIIRDSISAGFQTCDLMEGLTEYKFRVGGGLSWFSRHTILPRGIEGVKGRAFLGLLKIRSLWHPRRLVQRIRSVHRHGDS
jgi:CelD/BcsL family acetyltransferase involved in cellulose biosynthesis